MCGTVLENRPDKLLCSDDVIYTLDGNRIWRPLSDQELGAEIRATDPTTDLDVNKIYLLVKAIKLALHQGTSIELDRQAIGCAGAERPDLGQQRHI